MQFLGNTWRAGTDPVPAGECPGSQAFTGNPIGPAIPEGQESRGYATDGDGRDWADPWNWFDATHAAARYLADHGWPDEQRGALLAYNPWEEYVDAVLDLAAGYREVEARLQEQGLLPTGLELASANCPRSEPSGSTTPMNDPDSTQATLAMADAVIACFGRPWAVYCEDPRDGTGEHPRGRACDFMATSGGVAAGDERAWGDQLAEWVMANADSLNVIYVIWYRRIWNVGVDGAAIPWSEWRDYNCRRGCGPSDAHYNHIHVSVRLMPGDPAPASCGARSSCSE
jgi:Transglycosylase SLT domain